MRQVAIFLGQATYADVAITEAMRQVNEFICDLAARIPEAQVKRMTQQLVVMGLDQWAYYTIMVIVDMPPDAMTIFDELHKEISYHVGKSL